MDARTRRALEQSKAALERDRAAAAEARSRIAAGNVAAAGEVATALRALLERIPDVAELAAGADDIATHLVAVVAGRLMEALRVDVRDPRILRGSIAGPGGAFDYGAVVLDTEDALLPDSLYVCTVDPADGNSALADAPMLAMEVAGRINKSTDRVRLLMLGDVDLAASFITELYGLAARGRFTDALDRAVARRLEAMPTEGDPPA